MYTSDPNQKERLEMMSGTSSEGKALYQSWVVDSCRHITHILEDMDTCKPPIDHILELLPRLQPRFYSIASSAKVWPSILRIDIHGKPSGSPDQCPHLRCCGGV